MTSETLVGLLIMGRYSVSIEKRESFSKKVWTNSEFLIHEVVELFDFLFCERPCSFSPTFWRLLILCPTMHKSGPESYLKTLIYMLCIQKPRFY